MLNPRNYLEDCARLGLKDLWATGIPWSAINAAIDRDFNYNIPEAAKADFMRSTGYQWDNSDDSLTKVLNCPRCNALNEVPWTTCGGVNPTQFVLHLSCSACDTNRIRFIEMPGTGWGDRGFAHNCYSNKCGREINHKLLRVHKFIRDTESLILNDWPLGGTILSMDGGLATDVSQTGFVNRLIQIALRVDILELMEKHKAPTMNSIKGLIERALIDKGVLRKVNVGGPIKGSTISSHERLAVRKMMSRYVSCNLSWLPSYIAREQSRSANLFLRSLSVRSMLIYCSGITPPSSLWS